MDDQVATAAIIEALLFVGEKPLTVETMSRVTEIDTKEVIAVLSELETKMCEEKRGLRIYKSDEGYQLGTCPEVSLYIEKLFTKEISGPLSAAALETLAIVAYKQPVTRVEIEAIRGVNSDGVLDTLVKRKLVAAIGRRDTLGRPMLYGTTEDFLKVFGIKDISDLPPLEKDTD